MARVWGHAMMTNGHVLETAKAVRVTIREIDGDYANVDTLWIPKSICEGLEIKRTVEDHAVGFEFSADLPDWFIANLDTRTGWQKRGERCPPMAQRPW